MRKAIHTHRHKHIQKQLTSHRMVKNLNVFLLRSRTSQGFPLSSLLPNTVLEVLDSVIKQEKEINSIQIAKEEGKC